MNAAHYNAIAQRLQLPQVRDGQPMLASDVTAILAALLDRIEALETEQARAKWKAGENP
jgi:hypothetical protein